MQYLKNIAKRRDNLINIFSGPSIASWSLDLDFVLVTTVKSQFVTFLKMKIFNTNGINGHYAIDKKLHIHGKDQGILVFLEEINKIK